MATLTAGWLVTLKRACCLRNQCLVTGQVKLKLRSTGRKPTVVEIFIIESERSDSIRQTCVNQRFTIHKLQDHAIERKMVSSLNSEIHFNQGHPTTVFSQMLLNAVLGYLEHF